MNKIFIRALKKIRLLSFLNLNGTINCNNKSFTIPILQEVGFSNLYLSEPWMTDLLKIVLPIDKKQFVDIGVNVGQTLIKLKSVNSEIEYIGFEPNPICINYVDQLIKKNHLNNIKLLPIGVSDQTEIGVLNFFYSSSTDSSASMIEDFRPEQKINRKEYISLFRIDQIKEKVNLEAISILKIDVEGAELEVLYSFRFLIAEQHPIILIEILPAYNEKNKFRIERQNKIQELIREADYSMYRVIKQNEILMSFEEISEIGIHSDLNKCEYVMVPNIKKVIFTKYYKEWFNYENI